MSKIIMEYRYLFTEPEINIDHSDYERRLKVIEERARQWIKGEHGYFAGSISTGGSSGGSSAKRVDKSEGSGIIKTKEFKPLSDSKVVPAMRKAGEKWVDNLSDEEIISIQKYTKNSGDPKDDKFYDRLNSALRGERPLDDSLKYHSDNISKAIGKFELSEDIVCYRTTSKNFYESAKVGDIIVPNFFFSTAVTKGGTLKGDFTTVIQVPKGSKGAYIENLSKYPKQREFLLDKSCKYRILENSKNSMRIEVIKQ